MNILIVKLTSMGDLLQALPAVTDASRARSDVMFDWVVDEAFAEIPHWHPAVRKVITTAHRRWRGNIPDCLGSGELKNFWRQLRSEQYDIVIDTQANLKSALVTTLARGVKHGLDRSSVREYPAHWAYKFRYSIPAKQLAINRWRGLFAQVLDYPQPQSAPDFGLSGICWPTPERRPERPYIMAVPNASWENKYWQDSQWRDLIRIAGIAGFQVLLTCGSAAEFDRSASIARGQDNARALPRTSLAEVAALLKESAGAVCMDTGLAHLSAALDVPTVTLYGPTDPRLIGATGSRSVHMAAAGYDCIPCYRRFCEIAGGRGGDAQCLAGINASEVWQTLNNMITCDTYL